MSGKTQAFRIEKDRAIFQHLLTNCAARDDLIPVCRKRRQFLLTPVLSATPRHATPLVRTALAL